MEIEAWVWWLIGAVGLGIPLVLTAMPEFGMFSAGAVSAAVTAPGGVKSVLLRYRHVTQTEDYQTAEMTLDPKTGQYVGRIPASFINPKWDLMYFVEVIGNNHVGRMYPDADSETPYVVATVQR